MTTFESTHLPEKPSFLDIVVIGGGQAGLAIGYFLRRTHATFEILDAQARTGDSWRARYDSLVLFTPAKRDALPGLIFPGDPARYPTKDDVAAYLEGYARTFALPIRHEARVTGVSAIEGGFEVRSTKGTYHARAVVVATGPFQRPFAPPFASKLAPEVIQIHSDAYRHPGQLPSGRVVVVGSGNSGAQIAEELSVTHDVTVAQGRPQPVLPQRFFGRDIFDVLDPLGFFDVPAASWLGRQLRRRDPVIGTNLRQGAREGRLTLTERIVDAEDRTMLTANGARLRVDAVVWATGFRPDYAWLDVNVLDAAGRPIHQGGVTSVPGLFFLGLPWQRTRGSALLGGVAKDAEVLARRLTKSR